MSVAGATPPVQALGRVYRAAHAVAMACAVLGSIGTLGILALINADVIGRGVFATPMPATAEIVSAAIVSIVFLQLPHATLKGRNIRSDMLIGRIERRRPRAALALDTLHHAVGTGMLAIMVYYVAPHLITAMERQETIGLYGVLLLPSWPFVLMVVTGLALSLLAYALLTLGYLRAVLAAEGAR